MATSLRAGCLVILIGCSSAEGAATDSTDGGVDDATALSDSGASDGSASDSGISDSRSDVDAAREASVDADAAADAHAVAPAPPPCPAGAEPSGQAPFPQPRSQSPCARRAVRATSSRRAAAPSPPM